VRLRLVPLAALAAVIVGGWCSPAEAAQSGLCGGQITIPVGGPASPYPSNCVIADRTGTITDVDFRIQGLSTTWPDHIDMLLVGPGGENAIVCRTPADRST
jgi:hypothetical protein